MPLVDIQLIQAIGHLVRRTGTARNERKHMARSNSRAAIPRGRTWELPENATMRLPRVRFATVVRAERGTVLVTQEGKLDDLVLEPGDEAVLLGRGLAVAWAFTEASISVREGANCGSVRRPTHNWIWSLRNC